MPISKFWNEILPQMSAFLGVFFLVMLVGYGFLYTIDFVPETPKDTIELSDDPLMEGATGESQLKPFPGKEYNNVDPNSDPLPDTLHIPALGRSVTVLNPTSNKIADIDAALINGVARHPDSADLHSENGNMLILGHSSYLKTVFNKNYQAFNGIQNLEWGDQVILRSFDTEYTYRVDRVYEAKNSDVFIPTVSTGQRLTLVTCDTYGAKEDRFILEATLVSKRAL